MNSKKAIILLSGGLDSTTCLAIAKSKGYKCYALSFDYGQRHDFELQAAKTNAQRFGVEEHKIMKIDLRAFGASALTDDIVVPKNRTESEMQKDIPITYVPARNTIFLSFALAYAEVVEAHDIFIGVNAIDYSGYPDCRPEYIKAFQDMARIATKAAVQEEEQLKIHTPLIDLKKSEIIKLGLDLNVDYSKTFSCYDPDENGFACSLCDACSLRSMGFKQLGLSDPVLQQKV